MSFLIKQKNLDFASFEVLQCRKYQSMNEVKLVIELQFVSEKKKKLCLAIRKEKAFVVL